MNTWKRIAYSPDGIALGSCILLQGILMAVISPLLPVVISDRIGLDKSGVTLFFLINALLGTAVTILSGYLSDGAVARYKLVLAGGLTATVGYLGIAAASLPIHAFIAGPITAMLAVLFPQLFAMAKAGVVADWERTAQMSGITAFRTLFSFGFILGTVISSIAAKLFDIQAVFFINGIAVIGLTLFSASVLARMERRLKAQGKIISPSAKKMEVSEELTAISITSLIVPLLALVLLRGADSTRGVYLSLVMFNIFHDPALAPLMFGITATGELITMGLLAWVANKIGEQKTIALGAWTGAIYFLIMTSTQSLPVLYAVHVLYAVFVASLVGVGMAYVQGLFVGRAGFGGSVYMAALNVGSLVGILTPLLIAGYSQAVFIIPTILCIVGAVLLMVNGRRAHA